MEQAWNAGIVVVVAAGNEGRNNTQNTSGYGTITAPGNDPFVITVGAMKDMGTITRTDDRMATYSSKGPTMFDHVVKPDVVAPGNKIIASIPVSIALTNANPGNKPQLNTYTYDQVGASTNYFMLSGTSMATPMVSGTAALMLQKDPSLTPDAIKARIMKTATKSFPTMSTSTDPSTGITYTTNYDLFTVGAGYLDAWAALNNTDSVPGGKSANSPTVTFNPSTNRVDLVLGNSVMWGDSVMWAKA